MVVFATGYVRLNAFARAMKTVMRGRHATFTGKRTCRAIVADWQWKFRFEEMFELVDTSQEEAAAKGMP